MLNQREAKEIENKILAPYAMKSGQSRGRVYQEKEHSYRLPYQRDRDRIIHCAAFRRLEYKTQVFVNHEGDYYRTRLTHTLEVTQIARTIAFALRLNTDLTEVIALAHDLGHTPFGHAGEEVLAELMKNEGGFEHNLQGLRVVELLEKRYPRFPGLNLTWEVREGIAKHSSKFDHAKKLLEELAPEEQPTLEAQIVDFADEIAYDNHDLDDGLTSGLLSEEELQKLPLWKNIHQEVKKRSLRLDREQRKFLIIRTLIDMQVTDLLRQTERHLRKIRPRSPQDIKNMNERTVAFSPKMQELRIPLRELLFNKLYYHWRVVRMAAKAKRFIKELFNAYVSNPGQLPVAIQRRVKTRNIKRIVCDYIAGMTDRYALNEYKKFFDPYTKV